MKTRDIATIVGAVMRLSGIPLMLWGPTKEHFYIGLALLMSGEVGPIGRALIPTNPPDRPEARSHKKKPHVTTRSYSSE